jgi:hypothetical protein
VTNFTEVTPKIDGIPRNHPASSLARKLLLTLPDELGENMVLSKEKVKVLAEQNGWPLAQAQGYVDGETARRRGKVPPKYVMIGIDEYCRGYRAGFFATVRNSPSANPADKGAAPR